MRQNGTVRTRIPVHRGPRRRQARGRQGACQRL